MRAPLALAVLAIAACGGTRLEGVGSSSSRALPDARGVTDAGADRRGGGDAGTVIALAGLRKIASGLVTTGHAAGRWDAEVYASDDATAAALASTSAGGELAVGSRIVMVHRERAGGEKGPTMLMEKRPKGYAPERGDWRYVVVTGAGGLVADGPVESCAGCHDDAPGDRLFAVTPPRP